MEPGTGESNQRIDVDVKINARVDPQGQAEVDSFINDLRSRLQGVAREIQDVTQIAQGLAAGDPKLRAFATKSFIEGLEKTAQRSLGTVSSMISQIPEAARPEFEREIERLRQEYQGAIFGAAARIGAKPSAAPPQAQARPTGVDTYLQMLREGVESIRRQQAPSPAERSILQNLTQVVQSYLRGGERETFQDIAALIQKAELEPESAASYRRQAEELQKDIVSKRELFETLQEQLANITGRTPLPQTGLAQTPIGRLLDLYRKEIEGIPGRTVREKMTEVMSGGVTNPIQSRAIIQQAIRHYDELRDELKKRRASYARAEQDLLGLGLTDDEMRQRRNKIREMMLEDEAYFAQFEDIFGTAPGRGGPPRRRTRHGILPAYIGTVINMAGQALNAYAQSTYAEKTMFDITSLPGQVNATLQLEMFKRQLLWRTGSQITGMGVGALVAGTMGLLGLGPVGWGAGALALAGGFVGGQVTTPIGEAIASFINARDERQRKLFEQTYGVNLRNIEALRAVQVGEYTLAARGGFTPSQAAQIMRLGVLNTAMMPEQAVQAAIMFGTLRGAFSEQDFTRLLQFQARTKIDLGQLVQFARVPRLTGGTLESTLPIVERARTELNINQWQAPEFLAEWAAAAERAAAVFTTRRNIEQATQRMMRLPMIFEGTPSYYFVTQTPQGRQQVAELFQGIMTPKNVAEEALLFTAIHRTGEDYRKTILRMRQGIFGKGNLEAVLKLIEQTGLAPEHILALTEGKNLSPELTEELMRLSSTPEGRRTIIERMAKIEGEITPVRLEEVFRRGALPPGQAAAARMQMENVDAARKVQSIMMQQVEQHNRWLNAVTTTATSMERIVELTGKTKQEMEKALIGGQWIKGGELFDINKRLSLVGGEATQNTMLGKWEALMADQSILKVAQVLPLFLFGRGIAQFMDITGITERLKEFGLIDDVVYKPHPDVGRSQWNYQGKEWHGQSQSRRPQVRPQVQPPLREPVEFVAPPANVFDPAVKDAFTIKLNLHVRPSGADTQHSRLLQTP